MDYYKELSLGRDGEIKAEPGSAPPPKAATELLKRYKTVLSKLKLYGPYDEARTFYAQDLFNELEAALNQISQNVAQLETPKLAEAERYIGMRYGVVSLKEENLHFSKAPWAGASIPDAAMAFLSRVDKMCGKVRFLLKGSRTEGQKSAGAKPLSAADSKETAPKQLTALDIYLQQLLSHAKMGLEDGDIKSATIALDLFAEQFVNDEGPAIRQKHVRTTLTWALSIAVATLTLFLLVRWISSITSLPDLLSLDIDWPEAALTLLCLVAGVSIGITFFAFVRNLNLTFDTLGRFDPASLSSPLRFTLVGIVTAITCLLMGVGLLKIEIGGVKLHEFGSDPKIAILLGVICGYADVAITGMLTSVLDTVNKTR